jgi:pyrroloquinoline quinone biosynthesis protein B
MKIVILRGGGTLRRRRTPPGQAGSTRERGVMALGNGSGRWVLVNMSPGVAHQLDSDLRLDMHLGLPEPEVRAVVLTDAQVDHVGGLLSLRDGAPIDLYATPAVFEQLTTELPVLPVLQHYCAVHWHVVPVAGDRRVASFRVDGMPTLQFTAVATQSPLPPHLASTTRGEQPQVGDSIALAVQDLATGQRVFCAPGLSQIGATEFEWMREADCLLLDNLLPDTGMAAGDQPWLDLLRGMPARHKVLFADEPDTEGDAALAEEGIALAYDGMEIEL